MSDDDLGRQLAVLAAEVRMSRDELARRFDEQGVAFRELRTEMTTNYVTREHHSSDIGRLTDRVVNVESDLVDVRTQSAASLVELHGHIDRRFDEIKEQRRWTGSQIVLIGGTVLTSVTAIAIAVAQHH